MWQSVSRRSADLFSPMFSIQDEAKLAVYVHVGMVRVVDDAHNTLESLIPAIAFQRVTLAPYQIRIRNGKVKWIRKLPVVEDAPVWQPGYRSEWGACVQPLPAGF